MNELLKIDDGRFVKLIERLKTLIKNTAFENHVYVVGGFVRDAILGNPVHDIDIVVDTPNGGITFATWIAWCARRMVV